MSICDSEGSPGSFSSADFPQSEDGLCQSDGEGGGGADGGASRIVIVDDARGIDVGRLEEALAGCQLSARRMLDASATGRLRRSDDCGIALVAVTGEPQSGSPALETVTALKRSGY